MAVGAVIVAAGRSERMGGVDKLLAPLAGRPLLARTIAAFACHPAVDALIVVASTANLDYVAALARDVAPSAQAVSGGARRRDSVRAGLDALPAECDLVLVHDGARPLVTPELIDAAIAGARVHGAALCAVPVADTVKRADDSGLVQGTLARRGLWLAQTPQAFRRDLLRRAHDATDADATDDAALVELLGEPVYVVPGSTRNLKVTMPEDLRLAEALLSAQEPPP